MQTAAHLAAVALAATADNLHAAQVTVARWMLLASRVVAAAALARGLPGTHPALLVDPLVDPVVTLLGGTLVAATTLVNLLGALLALAVVQALVAADRRVL